MVWWEALAETSAYPQYVAVLAMLALAATLVWIDFNNTAHRVFALLLVGRATVMLSAVLNGIYVFSPPPAAGGIGDPHAAAVWAAVLPYFAIAMPFLILRFATVYPRRRTWFGRTRAGGWTILAGLVIAEALYLMDHGLFFTAVPFVTTQGDLSWPTVAYRFDGPLATSLGLMYFGTALLAVLFTVDYVRLPPGPRKNGVFVVALGFLLNALYDSSLALFSIIDSFGIFVSFHIAGLIALGFVPSAIAIALLVRHTIQVDDAVVDLHIKRALTLAPFPIISGAFAIYSPLSSLEFIQLILTGFWRLWLPALVTYALVRHQLFDIDLKIKFALRHSTLVGFAFVAFVVLSESLEAMITSSPAMAAAVPEQWTDLASIGVAVGLTYALNPVKSVARLVANRAMPNTENTESYLARKRTEVFRATLEGVVEDGVMTDREKAIVERLRVQLGLSEAEAKPILADVKATYQDRMVAPGARRAATP